jgi:hypothetical protein
LPQHQGISSLSVFSPHHFQKNHFNDEVHAKQLDTTTIVTMPVCYTLPMEDSGSNDEMRLPYGWGDGQAALDA